MMTKSLLLGLTAFAATGTTITTSVFFGTQKSIWDKVFEDAIPNLENSEDDESLNDIWAALKTRLSSKEVKDQELTSIKSDNQDSRGESLKKWCFNSYKKIYWNWFKEEQTSLLNDVVTACVLPIKEKLNSNKFEITQQASDSTNEEKLKKKAKELKSHDHNKSKLEKELIAIAESSNPEEKWKDLEKWCGETYEKGYQGNKSNRWQLVELYCKKQ